jgi:hypothetical protein
MASTKPYKKEDAPKFGALLTALQKLRVEVPTEIRGALTQPNVPKEISEMLRE